IASPNHDLSLRVPTHYGADIQEDRQRFESGRVYGFGSRLNDNDELVIEGGFCALGAHPDSPEDIAALSMASFGGPVVLAMASQLVEACATTYSVALESRHTIMRGS